MNYINNLIYILEYLFLFLSFFCVYAVTRKEGKNWLYISLIIYLPTLTLYTYLLIDEIISPSIDANIGFGISILLMRIVSITGVIAAGISYLVKKMKLQ